MAAGVQYEPSRHQHADGSLLTQVGDKLLKKWDPGMLIITLGPQGMYVVSREGEAHLIPTRAQEVFDVSGAGDTVIAACVLSLAAGADNIEAASIANYAAGVVVGKVGTACCTRDELLSIAK